MLQGLKGNCGERFVRRSKLALKILLLILSVYYITESKKIERIFSTIE